MFMLIIDHQVDQLFPGGVGGIINYRGMAIGFYTVYLLLSIFENYAVIGMPFPKKFKQVLEVIREDSQNL